MLNTSTALKQTLSRLKNVCAVLVLVFVPLAAPLQARADSTTCTPPPDSSYGAGVHHPTGSDAGLFIYNCSTGLWVSPHYTYDPTTGTYTSNDPTVYTYDPSTGNYDYDTWEYDAPNNDYVEVAHSTATPPAGATVVGAPAPVASTSTPAGADTNSISNTGSGSNNNIDDNGGVTDGSSIDNTGSDSNNNIGGSATNNNNQNNNSGVSVNNTLDADSTTGNASLLGNTTAGSASSGDATVVANEMNLLQSTSDALGGNTVTFVANIDGNVNGDLLLDPSTLSDIQPTTDADGTNTTNIDNSSDESITNNLNLDADTGNVTVNDNTSAGDATSGTAKTIANVINVIDSAITSGKSFLGVININGDLNGSILLPANFVNQLLAANVPTVNIITGTGANSSNTITDNDGSNNTDIDNANNEQITNNVNTTATTGSANLNDNTSAGDATTGNADTGITAFNLTGSSVVGSNDLLVFVNVVGGSWVGLIVDAPAGATAAELGGGIVSDSSDANNNTNVANNSNQTITNNLNLDSASGNADADRNTQVGNATSGDADDAVNLLNVENSSLSLSNWFGILFINVFGTWNGNFGVSAPAGETGAGGSSLPGSFVAAPAFSFSPAKGSAKSIGSGSLYSNLGSIVSSANSDANSGTGNGNGTTGNSILAAARNNNLTPHSIVNTPSHLNWGVIAGGSGILVIYLLGERFYAVRQRSRS